MKQTPKLVVEDRRDWAEQFFLGDQDPKEYPQAAEKTKDNAFRVLTAHNTVAFKVAQKLSAETIEGLLLAGWKIDIKPMKD